MKKRAALIFVLLLGGGFIAWWVLQPPSPETVAKWTVEAIANRDAQRLWQLMCEAERERVSPENLQRVLDQLHANFPYLADLKRPTALDNRSRAAERNLSMRLSVHEVRFFYRHTNRGLEPLSSRETVSALAGERDEARVAFRIFVNRSASYEKVCPLVIHSLVMNTISAAHRANQSVPAKLDEIFLKNNIRTALYNPDLGEFRRIQVVEERQPDGTIKYYW